MQSTKNNFVFDSTKLRILKATAEVTLQLFFEIVVNSRYGKGVWYKQLYEPVSTFVNFESNVSKKTLTATATLYPHDIYFDTSDPNTFDRASFRSYKALLYQHHYGWRNSRRPIHLDRVSFSTGHSVLTYTRATPPHSNIAIWIKVRQQQNVSEPLVCKRQHLQPGCGSNNLRYHHPLERERYNN